jgi:hypothetical protein
MTTRSTRSIVIAAILAATVAGMPADAAAKKNRLRATVNGKTIKFSYHPSITAGGDTVAFFVIGQTRPRPRGIFRTLGVACGDFPPPAVPGPSMFCTGNYQETNVRNPAASRFWTALVGGVQVNFDSYDGTNIAGTFSGTLTSVTGDPPITVDGLFRGGVGASSQ